ncbi:MAG TPA: hypothetical protein VMF30_03195 [Pirellulales bacterium]|nr:hypothetical protein [Pirellulales bacterium]
MSPLLESPLPTFLDRRSPETAIGVPTRERRQFTNSHDELSPPARELAQAIDAYKLRNRRRFITYEEMLTVIQSLGYHKSEDGLT